MTATQTRITEGAETRVVKHRNTRSSAAGDRNHQPQWITGLVNEQEQSQPQRIHARHQGTQSPQISVTLILYHSSGAEVLARRLIGTCTQMEPITENVTATPPFNE